MLGKGRASTGVDAVVVNIEGTRLRVRDFKYYRRRNSERFVYVADAYYPWPDLICRSALQPDAVQPK